MELGMSNGMELESDDGVRLGICDGIELGSEESQELEGKFLLRVDGWFLGERILKWDCGSWRYNQWEKIMVCVIGGTMRFDEE
eukprot:14312674-Ditylum_brightwellii.AAC.1